MRSPHFSPGLPSGFWGEARQHPRASEVVMQKRKQSFSRRRQLEERARLMLAWPSWPEQVLFRAIGGRLGVCVKRQVVLGEHIVDFAIASRRLVIEVDGPHHALRRSADVPRRGFPRVARRDRVLSRLGWRVVRVSADDVCCDVQQVVSVIRAALEA